MANACGSAHTVDERCVGRSHRNMKRSRPFTVFITEKPEIVKAILLFSNESVVDELL